MCVGLLYILISPVMCYIMKIQKNKSLIYVSLTVVFEESKQVLPFFFITSSPFSLLVALQGEGEVK